MEWNKISIFFTALVFLYHSKGGSSVRLDVTSTVIQPGLKNFTVICSVPQGSSPKFNSMSSIVIYRSVQSCQSDPIALAKIKSDQFPQVNIKDAVGAGTIYQNGDSFLSLTWLCPTSDLAGEYTCEVNGMDADWRPLTVIEKVTVNDQRSSSSSSSSISLSRIEASKLWFFKRSEVYKGRRYYLSQQDPISRSEQSMATCVLYGGYLAEIDDLDEFNFIKTFIKQFTGFRLVLIGATDEETEEVWTYRQSRTIAPQFLVKSRKWGKAHNCLYLYDAIEWLAVDDLCYYTNSGFPTRFLCEIPEDQ